VTVFRRVELEAMTQEELLAEITDDAFASACDVARPCRPLTGNALRGLKRGLRGYSRFSALIFFASIVIAAAAVLDCDVTEWCLILGAIGLVLAAELFHGAVQNVVRALEQTAFPPGLSAALDMAAASAFIANFVAVLIGVLVFYHRVSALFCS
jgi:diacylglycerol kinase